MVYDDEAKFFLATKEFKVFWDCVTQFGYMITALRPEHLEAIADKIGLKQEKLTTKQHLYSEEKVILLDDEYTSKDGNVKTRELLLIGFMYCKKVDTFDDIDDKIQNLWYLVNPNCSTKVPVSHVQLLMRDMLYIAISQRIKVIDEYEDTDNLSEEKLKKIEKENG